MDKIEKKLLKSILTMTIREICDTFAEDSYCDTCKARDVCDKLVEIRENIKKTEEQHGN